MYIIRNCNLLVKTNRINWKVVNLKLFAKLHKMNIHISVVSCGAVYMLLMAITKIKVHVLHTNFSCSCSDYTKHMHVTHFVCCV